MTKREFKKYVEDGYIILFEYDGRRYCISRHFLGTKLYYTFGEVDKRLIKVFNFDQLCRIKRNGTSVLEMWEALDKKNSFYKIMTKQ